MQTIFITIPSYEDSDLLPTIEMALSKADHPENLHFAIALQYKNTELPNLEKYYSNPNFSFVTYDVDTRPGVNQVRHNLLRFYSGQDYYLMIDSHSRFAKSWDSLLISDYKKLQSNTQQKVIISRQMGTLAGKMCSCDSRGSEYFSACDGHEYITVWGFSRMTDVISLGGYPAYVPSESNNELDFLKIGYASCHFFFTDANFIGDVGIADKVSFQCEESMLSIRSFFAGWDIYAQTRTSYIEHSPQRYNSELYGTEFPNEKAYAREEDYRVFDDLVEIRKLFLENSGSLMVKNATRTPEDFFESIGLLDEFLKIKLEKYSY